MMGQTQNYAIPYPECDPPLRQDASDIADMRDLAVAADSALSAVYDKAGQLVFTPDAIRMSTEASVGPVTGNVFRPVYNLVSFQQSSDMADVTNGVIRLVEPGRYWVGTYVSLTAPTVDRPRVQFLFNGEPVSNYQTPGATVGTTTVCQAHAVLATTAPNVALHTQVKHSSSAALSYSYTSRIWALQLVRY